MVPILLRDGHGSTATALRGEDGRPAGARGYLVKGAEREEIVRAITTVAAGGAVFGATLAQRIAEFFAAGRQLRRFG